MAQGRSRSKKRSAPSSPSSPSGGGDGGGQSGAKGSKGSSGNSGAGNKGSSNSGSQGSSSSKKNVSTSVSTPTPQGGGPTKKAQPSTQNKTTKQTSVLDTKYKEADRFPNNSFYKGVSPNSKEGKTIQAILERQRLTKALNKEQDKMVRLMAKAKNTTQAYAIRDKMISQNPNLGTNQVNFNSKTGKIYYEHKRPDYIDSFVLTDKKGNPNNRTILTAREIDGGKVTLTGKSRDSSWDFFEPQGKIHKLDTKKSINPASVLNFGNWDDVPEYEQDWLSDDQKAFGFMPDQPKGKDPVSEYFGGAIRESSNFVTMGANLGGMGVDFVTGKPVKQFPYYRTPMTEIETSFLDVGVDAVQSKLEGTEYTWDDAGNRIKAGLKGAKKSFDDDFFGSLGATTVGVLPYVIPYGGAMKFFGHVGKIGGKVGGKIKVSKNSDAGQSFLDNFMKGNKRFKKEQKIVDRKMANLEKARMDKKADNFIDTLSHATEKTNQKFPLDGVPIPVKTGKTNKMQDAFGKYFKTDYKIGGFLDTTKKAPTLKQVTKVNTTVPKETKANMYFSAGKFLPIGQYMKQSSVLVTKPVTKQQAKSDFFGPVRTNTSKSGSKSILKTEKIIPEEIVKPASKPPTPIWKLTQKPKQKLRQPQGVIPSFKFFQSNKITQSSILSEREIRTPRLVTSHKYDFFGPVPLKVVPKKPTRPVKGVAGAVAIPPFFQGYHGLGSKKTKKGNKAFTAWNVDKNRAGRFLKGPSYKKSRTDDVFVDLDIRTAKAQKGRKKDVMDDFFGRF